MPERIKLKKIKAIDFQTNPDGSIRIKFENGKTHALFIDHILLSNKSQPFRYPFELLEKDDAFFEDLELDICGLSWGFRCNLSHLDLYELSKELSK